MRWIPAAVANIGRHAGEDDMKTADVGKTTRYSGFKSFQYLEPGTDYREFKLAKELDRVPSRKVDVSGAQEDRVQRLLAENLAVSLHDHGEGGLEVGRHHL